MWLQLAANCHHVFDDVFDDDDDVFYHEDDGDDVFDDEDDVHFVRKTNFA